MTPRYRKILDNLWQVGGDDLSAPEDAAVYLAVFGDRGALVDAGTGRSHAALCGNIRACLPSGASIAYLFLTHCHYDHTGGALGLRDVFGCSIVAHALDAPYVEEGDSRVTAASWYGAVMEPFAVDVKIQGESQAFDVGTGVVRALHVPGHSPGSVVYVATISGQKVLFGQDVHGPLSPLLLSDEEAYQASLQKMLDIQADILCEGHYGVFKDKTPVADFIRSFME